MTHTKRLYTITSDNGIVRGFANTRGTILINTKRELSTAKFLFAHTN